MAEYKVKQISGGEPRKWDGPNGTVFYIKVMLEGHDRPVSIGKKSPDALKVGDTVYGTINPDPQHPEDKFKADSKPFAGGGYSGGGSSKPAYQPKDEHAIAKAVALKASVDMYGNMESKLKTTEAVLAVADEFLAWLEADKHKLDTTLDPMDKVHAQNPLNDNFGEVEYVNTQDLPPDF